MEIQALADLLKPQPESESDDDVRQEHITKDFSVSIHMRRLILETGPHSDPAR